MNTTPIRHPAPSHRLRGAAPQDAARGSALPATVWVVPLLAVACAAGCSRRPPDEGVRVASPAAPPAAAKVLFRTVAPATSGLESGFSDGHVNSDHSILAWMGGGAAVIDYDRDGRRDLFFAGGGDFVDRQSVTGAPSLLYRHTGELKFALVAAQAGVARQPFYSQGCHVGDYDNDGFADILVTGYGGLQLFHNQGDGTFVELAEAAGLGDDRLWSTAAAWADFDGDGLLDLYVVHYLNWSFDNHPPCSTPNGEPEACPPWKFDPQPDSLYFNNGDGTFRDASRQAGLRSDGRGLGVVAADLDHDSDIDLYVANDSTENFLYINVGRGQFEEKGLLHGVAGDDVGDVDGSMGVDVGDWNLDGLPDLFVTNYVREANGLYTNLGEGQFQHVSRPSGINNLNDLFVGFGTAFLDLECDGDEDLVVTNGHVLYRPPTAPVEQQPLLLINHRGQRFTKLNPDDNPYFAGAHLGRGLVTSDLDDDGDLDLVITHLRGEPPALLRNDTPREGDWLRVELAGRGSNRDAVGARLELTTSSGTQLRTVKGGGSYLSHLDPRAFFGIPAGATVEKLTITWPSGLEQIVDRPATNQTLRVIEPEAAASSHAGSSESG